MTTRTLARALLLTLICMAAGAMVSAAGADPVTIVVNSTQDSNASCGSVCSLRSAIIQANNAGVPVTIVLPAGTYKLTLSGSDDTGDKGDFDVTGDVTIVGEGADTTIIDGNHIDTVFSVLHGGRLTLVGVTVQKGGSPFSLAGAIWAQGDLTLQDVEIKDNTSGDDGAGGIYALGSANITGSRIENNTAGNDGKAGGVYGAGDFTLTSSVVSSNSVASGGVSGGVFASGAFVGRDLTVSFNSASGDDVSGGMTLADYAPNAEPPTATLERVTIIGNTGGGADSAGGMISNGHLTATDLIMQNNHGSGHDGIGGLYQVIGTISIDRAVIAGNNGDVAGGAWVTAPGTITNTTIDSNHAVSDGTGGILVGNPFFTQPLDVTLASSAVTNNTQNGLNNVVTLHVVDSIFSANTPKNCTGDHPLTAGVNIDSADTCGFHVPDLPTTDPLLGPLQNNGGFVLTRAPGDGSPAIDAVGSDDCPPPDHDARNYIRFAGTACDIGPVETNSAPNEIWGDQDCNGVVTGVDALMRLEKAAGIQVMLPIGCPDDQTYAAHKSFSWNDLDCNLNEDAADAIPILAYLGGSPLQLIPECAPIGTAVSPVVQGK